MKKQLIKTYIVLTLAVFSQATGNVLLSKGMREIALVSTDSRIISNLILAISNPLIWLGIILSLLFFALFAASLTWADLSFVQPMISFDVVLNVAFAAILLGETVSPKRWLGTLLISLGVIFVSLSAKHSVRSHPPVQPKAGGAL